MTPPVQPGGDGLPGRTLPSLSSALSMDVLLLLVAMVWGGSYSAVKVASGEVPVLQLLALRFGLSFLLLLPALRGLAIAGWPAALGAATLVGLSLLAVFVCETLGVSLTQASNAAFLISLCVAFTPLCEWWMLGRKPSPSWLLAALVSLLGAGLLAFQTDNHSALHVWGDALMVAAAWLRAVIVCLTHRHSQRHGLPAMTLTAIQMGVMTAGCGLLMLVSPGPVWVPLPASPSFWAALAYLVLLCSVLAFYAQNHAAAWTRPSRVSLLMGSEPLWGALIAAVWMGEQLTPVAWLGGVLIAGSCAWVAHSHAQADATAPGSGTSPHTNSRPVKGA
jgi:drug/metabolite transporter (DMT)-like permease